MTQKKLLEDRISTAVNSWFDSLEHILDAYDSYVIPSSEYEKECKKFFNILDEMPITDFIGLEGLKHTGDNLNKYLLVTELKDLCLNHKSDKKDLSLLEELCVSLKISLSVMGNKSESMQKLNIIASCLYKREPIISNLDK